MESCYFYDIEAALERLNRRPYQLDVIISSTRYPGTRPRETTSWDIHFVVPEDHMVF